VFVKGGGVFLQNLLISGYRSYELNIFDQTDPKYKYLKKFIENRLLTFIENGVEWFIIGGELGIELWAGEIILELKEEHPEIHLAVIFPYASFGKNWNEMNQALLERVTHQADYVNYTSNKNYESPAQLKANQVFNIRNTDGAFLVYDTLTEETAAGKPKFLYDLIVQYQEQTEYELQLASFEEIEFFIHEYVEIHGRIDN
jgi:uncharacterized phage-like protein YoqJ